MRGVWVLTVVLLAIGCTGVKLSTVRTAVSQQTACPEANLNVVETQGGWYATGCDTRYFCQSAAGPCAEDPTGAQRLAKARAVFSRETGCPLADSLVSVGPQGYVAQGCGRYSLCASYDGPCMPSRPPTCRELAQQRYDSCVAVARKDATEGRDNFYPYNRWGAAVSIAGAITSTVQGNKQLESCRAQFDAESVQCPQ